MDKSTPGMEVWPFAPLMMLVFAVLVPINVVLLYFLAFSNWPNLKGNK